MARTPRSRLAPLRSRLTRDQAATIEIEKRGAPFLKKGFAPLLFWVERVSSSLRKALRKRPLRIAAFRPDRAASRWEQRAVIDCTRGTALLRPAGPAKSHP